MNIGNNLKRIRKEKKMTLKNLAEISGLSISFISDIEHNRRNPSLETMNKLCKSLNIEISQLTSYYINLDDITGLKQQEINTFIQKFKKLNLKGQNKVKNYLEDILNNDQYTKELSQEEMRRETIEQTCELLKKLTNIENNND